MLSFFIFFFSFGTRYAVSGAYMSKKHHDQDPNTYETTSDVASENAPGSVPVSDADERTLREHNARGRNLVPQNQVKAIPTVAVVKHKQGTFYVNDADKIDGLGKAVGFFVIENQTEKEQGTGDENSIKAVNPEVEAPGDNKNGVASTAQRITKKTFLPIEQLESIEIYTFPTLDGYTRWSKHSDHVVEDDAWATLVVVQRP